MLYLSNVNAFGVGCSQFKQLFISLFDQSYLFFVLETLHFVCLDQFEKHFIRNSPFTSKPFLSQILSFVIINWQLVDCFFQYHVTSRINMGVFIHFLNNLLNDHRWCFNTEFLIYLVDFFTTKRRKYLDYEWGTYAGIYSFGGFPMVALCII